MPIRFRINDSKSFVERDEKTKQMLADFLLSSLQMQHVMVLAGSGASIGIGGPSMDVLWDLVVGKPVTALAQEILDEVHMDPAKRNIEELLSRCDALRQINETHKNAARFHQEAVDKILQRCREVRTDSASLTHHVGFLKRLSRRRARDSRLQLFTTNYDLAFDRAAAQLGFVAIDGFSFSSPRRFDARLFDYDIVQRAADSAEISFVPGVFQYAKLHGSVDWEIADGSTRINEAVAAERAALIYPAQSKYQLSYQQPHLELMARFLAALREPNTCLLTVGFGFADAHLVEPILAGLNGSHLRVVVVTPSVEKDLEDKTKASWQALGGAARSADLSFIGATFADLVDLIPDLRALNAAEILQRAVLGARGGP